MLDKLDFLINYLLKENTKVKVDEIPSDTLEKKCYIVAYAI